MPSFGVAKARTLFMAALATETNTFSPLLTSQADFEDCVYYEGDATNYPATLFTAPLHVWKTRASELNWTVIESLATWAEPGGRVLRKTYESLRDRILDDLRRTPSPDVVLLSLHGAMAADGYDDCEGDILEAVRAIVGPEAVVGASLDLHCVLTKKMMANADILVTFKENPHSDFVETAEAVFGLCRDIIDRRIQPVAAVVDLPLLDHWQTTVEPMSGFVSAMRRCEDLPGVLSVSFVHTFARCDVPEMGPRMLVFADRDAKLAQGVAEDLAYQMWSIREAAGQPYFSMDNAFELLKSIESRPVVFGDICDNAGGGAPSDCMLFLHEIMKRGMTDVVLGVVWDEQVVRQAILVGEGGRLHVRLGAKACPQPSLPCDIEVVVSKIIHGASQTFGSAKADLGDAVCLVAKNNTKIIVSNRRVQTYGRDAFENFDVDLKTNNIVIVKSALHFYYSFSEVSENIYFVDSGGMLGFNYSRLVYKNRSGDFWPKANALHFSPLASVTDVHLQSKHNRETINEPFVDQR